jgi:hypothetical protein
VLVPVGVEVDVLVEDGVPLGVVVRVGVVLGVGLNMLQEAVKRSARVCMPLEEL